MKFEEVMVPVASHADGKLLAGRIGKVGVVLFNQPDKRNAVSLEMWQGVCAVLPRFAADAQIRAVIYAGAGGQAFTSGNDISQFATRRDGAEADAEFRKLTGAGRDAMNTFAKPTIACIQGFCLGGGLVAAMSADLRVAAADSVFGIPAARMGLAYAFDAMERLVALVGPARARLMLFTAKRFSAQEAHAFGLVDVLAAEDPVSDALELAQAIADNAPLTVAAAKFAIEQIARAPGDRDVARMTELVRVCMDSADYREGRTAFMEKRKPVFTGI